MSFAVPVNKKKSKMINKKESTIVIDLSFDRSAGVYKLDFAGKKGPGQCKHTTNLCDFLETS